MAIKNMEQLTPNQIVTELDKYIIGQDKAKRAVAIALRNRWRRQRVDTELREEIMPNNIIMIGPTGVGKTEIARRLAKLADAPFIKVEASKFTEIGYVGRDVESMIRDLTELGVNMVKSEKAEEVQEKAINAANERILDLLLPRTRRRKKPNGEVETEEQTREKLRQRLLDGKLDKRVVELEMATHSSPTIEIFSNAGLEEMDINLSEMLGGMFPQRTKRHKLNVPEARRILIQEEAQKLIDMDAVVKEAIERVENSGMIFLDEIDKIASSHSKAGPDISREGVQRDILPLIEGSNVPTKYGMIKTDHILFISAGAFHISKPSDLIPELQGRFPIRVELDSLSKEDLMRILVEPKNALSKQYIALLATEDVSVEFTDDAIEEIAEIANQVNEQTENIGARRLHTILTILLEDILFDVPETKKRKFKITGEVVKNKLMGIVKDRDLSRYIL